jgi:hypothetical protein
MGTIAANTHRPLIGFAAWGSVAVAAFVGARYTFRRVATSKRKKLHEIANQIAQQIGESIQLALPAGRGETGEGKG